MNRSFSAWEKFSHTILSTVQHLQSMSWQGKYHIVYIFSQCLSCNVYTTWSLFSYVDFRWRKYEEGRPEPRWPPAIGVVVLH
jgi:hypothetical protein